MIHAVVLTAYHRPYRRSHRQRGLFPRADDGLHKCLTCGAPPLLRTHSKDCAPRLSHEVSLAENPDVPIA